jgi:hypothetical protein
VVNEYYPEPNDGDKSHRHAEQNETASKGGVDWLLAISTLLLFFATCALCAVAYWQWQTMKGHEKALTGMAGNMERGLVETAKAADAAKRSADALMGIERARISVMMGYKLPELRPMKDRLEMIYITPTVQNFGKTTGIASIITARLHVLPNSERLPANPDYSSEKFVHTVRGPIDIFPNIPWQPLRLGISNAEMGPILEAKTTLWLYGYVDYVDVFNTAHQTRFCYILLIPGGFSPYELGFYVSGPEEYNHCT